MGKTANGSDMQDYQSGNYENNSYLFQHSLGLQLVYSILLFILYDKCYYTIYTKLCCKVSYLACNFVLDNCYKMVILVLNAPWQNDTYL